jgi:excisionase family DNA binding protein
MGVEGGAIVWFKVREAANRWQCSPDTVLLRIRTGKLPAMKFNRSYRVHRDARESKTYRAVAAADPSIPTLLACGSGVGARLEAPWRSPHHL